MKETKYLTFEQLKDQHLGKAGTFSRDEYEAEVNQVLQAYKVGEAIREERKQQKMTQDQLAELMGVKKAQVSRIERGDNPTLNTILRAFKALGLPVSLSYGDKQIYLR